MRDDLLVDQRIAISVQYDHSGCSAVRTFPFSAQSFYQIILFRQVLWYFPSNNSPEVVEPLNWFFVYLLWLLWCTSLVLNAPTFHNTNTTSSVTLTEITDNQEDVNLKRDNEHLEWLMSKIRLYFHIHKGKRFFN